MRYYTQQANQAPISSDFGGRPFVIDINQAAMSNTDFRSALWTGDHLQLTVMQIAPNDDVGLETHDVDQMLYVVDGTATVQMGDSADALLFEQPARAGSAVFVPAHTWHNLTNTGQSNLVLYSIYAPPAHPFGTVHPTKADDHD